MGKHIHSKDPRKPAIVAALRKASGGTKITMLEEIAVGVFQGSCLKKSQSFKKNYWDNLGKFTITAKEAGI